MGQADLNASVWRAGRFTSDYDTRVLEPAEVLLLARWREAFSGRVLDVGCGAGRLLGYIVALGADAHGIDISPAMVELCRRRFPDADVRVGDLESLSTTVDGPFDVVLMSDNVLDVFDDARRRAVLADARGLLSPAGVLVFSSHNLSSWEGGPAQPGLPGAGSPGLPARMVQLANRSPVWMLNAAARLPRRRSNRRRLGPLQYRADDHAVVNDSAHDYSLLHYYISRDAQERQLAQLGCTLVEAVEFDGRPVPAGQAGEGPALYYVATSN
jgi:SAM-dependent methyltransferase